MQLSNVVRKAVFSMPSILYPQHVVQPPPEPGVTPNPHLSDLLGKSANPLRWVVETMFAVLIDQNHGDFLMESGNFSWVVVRR